MSNIVGEPPPEGPDPDRVEQSSSITGKPKASLTKFKNFVSSGEVAQDEAGLSTSDHDKANTPEETESREYDPWAQVDLTEDPEEIESIMLNQAQSMGDLPASQETHNDDTSQTEPVAGNDEAKPIRKRKPRAKGATLDGHDMRKVRELGLQKAMPKKWRKKGPALKEPVGERKGKTPKDEMTDERLAELFSNNVASGVQNAASKPAGPGFEGKVRRTELSRLARESGCPDDKTLVELSIKKFNTAPKITDDGTWQVKGLKKGLKNHQLLAVGWMRERERSQHPKGGMLCDQMGLGKTWDISANILDDQTYLKGEGPTLIVTTASTLSHWINHFHEHTAPEATGPVLLYQSSLKLDLEIVAKHGIIITSYSQVQSSYPNPDPVLRTDDQDTFVQTFKARFDQQCGMLHRVRWRRIVLDEAHMIKNHDKKTSIAIRSLQGEFKWVATGTPLHNSVHEFYSYFNFLGVPCSNSFEECSNKYFSGKPKAKNALYTLLTAILWRKTYNDKLFGSPIVSMPGAITRNEEVQGYEAEKVLYETISALWIGHINGMTGPGALAAQWKCVFVFFTNLRMLASHPLTLCRAWKQHISPSILDRLREVAKRQNTSEDPSVQIAQFILTMENRVMVPTAALKDPERLPESQTSDERVELIRSFQKIMMRYYEDGSKRPDSKGNHKRDSEAWISRYDRVKCPSCDFPPHRAIVTKCNHLYCEDCFHELPDINGEKGTSSPICLTCNLTISSFAACGPLDDSFFTPVEPLTEGKKRKSSKKRILTKLAKRAIVDFSRKHESDSSSEEEEQQDADWLFSIGSQMPGAKLDKVFEIVEKWIDEGKNDNLKILIFVQFVTTLNIIRDKCQSMEWKALTFAGSDSTHQRAQIIDHFCNEPYTILVSTLGTGGTGIDLSCANKCILVDLWWNEALEEQAFSRTMRIGQTRQVELVRIVLKNSLDTWILDMQQRKTRSINEIMGREKNDERTKARETLRFFGEVMIQDSHDGPTISIVPREKDSEGHEASDDEEPILLDSDEESDEED